MIRNFGLPIWSLNHYLPSRNLVWIFFIRKRQTDKAFNISDRFSNVTVSVMWRFKFISPQTGKVLSGQDDIPVVDKRLHNLQIYLRFAQHVTASLWLTLPFTDLNYDAVNYIKLLKNSLPFNISNNNWKQWKFTEGRLTARKLNISIVDVE